MRQVSVLVMASALLVSAPAYSMGSMEAAPKKPTINEESVKDVVRAFPMMQELALKARSCEKSGEKGDFSTPACNQFKEAMSSSKPKLDAALGHVESIISKHDTGDTLNKAEMHLVGGFMKHYSMLRRQYDRVFPPAK
uniref:Uncharacterized protein n=1 Tax=Magnetococcus massalia (strain MO-1) TaxID=451514 RepID=A0A1S7LLN3_MAGMO|nr:exported protein of unknown function [Candidatus Magnetococcus massalia]